MLAYVIQLLIQGGPKTWRKTLSGENKVKKYLSTNNTIWLQNVNAEIVLAKNLIVIKLIDKDSFEFISMYLYIS